ncbi:hypothetical protein, partial [Bradyrhizobium sp. NBAIM08]|uniref:hypothetical protein n=1 Tax=Bradyrhizobium sp. NBAIM08 TaxID=2793815 RepID=UPI001CD73F1C
DELRKLCQASFREVEVKGIFGSPAYMEIFDEERATLDRVLRFDPLKFRKAVPMKMRQRLYDTMLSRFRKDDDPRAAKITPDDFFLGDDGLDESLDVVAICRGPIR